MTSLSFSYKKRSKTNTAEAEDFIETFVYGYLGAIERRRQALEDNRFYDEDLKGSNYDLRNEDNVSEETFKLTHYERYALIGALNEIIDKLVLLGANKPKVAPEVNYHPLNLRFKTKTRKNIAEDTATTTQQEESYKQIRRFQKLRTLLEHIIKITRDEILERCTTEALSGFLYLEERKNNEESMILKSFDEYVALIENLISTSKANDRLTEETLARQEKQALELKGNIQVKTFLGGNMLSYSKHWEQAQIEVNSYLVGMKEAARKEALKELQNKFSHELRVHRDIVTYLKLTTRKLNKDIEKATKKYEKDIFAIDADILYLTEKRKAVQEKMRNMLMQFDKRQRRIKLYLAEKAERERIAAEEKRKRDAAVRIQSWWRGAMVRWSFGRFDPEKAKKKKGKGTKGKK